MKLQANYHGAWRNVFPPFSLSAGNPMSTEEHLKLAGENAFQGAKGLRIIDGLDEYDRPRVIWQWDRTNGWRRPHWYSPCD